MSLRLRLFLIFGGLLAALLLAQGWLVRSLTHDLTGELEDVAFRVGSSVASVFVAPTPGGGHEEVWVQEGGAAAGGGVRARRELVWRHGGQEGGAEGTRSYVLHVEGEPGIDEGGIDQHGADEHGADEHVSDGHVSDGHGAKLHVVKHLKLRLEHEHDEPVLALLGLDREHRIQVPHGGFESRLASFQRRLLLGSLGFLGLGLALAALVAHRVSRPLERLSAAADEVGGGALGTRVEARASGEVARAIGAFNQMSQRLGELEARNRQLAARRHLGEIGEIARALAHALRNPLNALGLSVEELAARVRPAGESEPGDDGEARELAEAARRQIRRIDGSIRSFLALASEGSGAVEEIDLAELASDIALEVLQDCRGRVRLEVEAHEGERLVVRAVPAELRAVLQALVVNAVEASPEGGKVRLGLTAAAPGRVRLEVDDRGPGLADEVRAALFTPHLSTKANGSGMGLFLAHRIVTTRYRGSLEIGDLESGDLDRGGTRAALEVGDRVEEAEEGRRDG